MSQIINKIIATNDTLSKVFTVKGKIYTFLNPVSYLAALDNKKLFTQFNGIFADGSILVLAIKLLYHKKISRISFDTTSLAPKLFKHAAKYNKTIYIIASKQKQIESSVSIFKKQYPNIQIIGFRNGYFNSKDEMEAEAENIAKINPDFLIVGMGVIAQEKFLLMVKEKGYSGIGFTCGGFIHQTSENKINYYPKWVNKLNLRFMYRMYKEKHTRKRYFQAAFIFPIKFIYEKIFDKS